MTEAGELLRALTIDPTRDYQPLNGRWPVQCLATGVRDLLRQDKRAGRGNRTPDNGFTKPVFYR